MNFQIRPSTSQDLKKIIELQTYSLRNLSPNYNTTQIESLVRSQASARLAENEIGLVAEHENEIIGFASFLILNSQISGVYVHPSFTRQGIGTGLLEAVEKRAIDRGYGTIYVTSSLSTVNFYRENDYQLIRQSGFYSEEKTWIPCINLEKQLISTRSTPKLFQRLCYYLVFGK
ncbi:MAG: GNAT family N-acetyltransferase [Symploca sp. SIO2G7]|nr:GNAT family N-acetyltransferase [Symploca sp. SIO2G7]